MTKDKATPRPWIVTHQTATDFSFDIVSPQKPNGVFIASCGKCQSEDSVPSANASLIVKAVNNYDALLEACKEAFDYIAQTKENDYGEEVLIDLREAITKAEGR